MSLWVASAPAPVHSHSPSSALLCSSRLVSFSHFAIAYLLAFYLLWFHFVRALVVVDSFEDNL